ncbi:MAG: hypothetical protein JNL83_04180 [Myxococcales bacterium]|nr:hypothetical protein [Myxococcales bacterium]
MGKTSAGAGPKQVGACVSFFVGTPDNEEQLALARTWAAGIVDAVGDAARAQLGMLVSISALLNQLRLMQDVIYKNPPGAPIAALGKLNQPTIVLLTHALPASTVASQAILLYGAEGGAGSVLITAAQLDQMSLKEVKDPLKRKAVVAPANADAQTKETAFFIDFLRRSDYVALYLCTVGKGRRVNELAAKLATLSDLTVYWNENPLVLSASGPPAVKDSAGSIVDGTEYQGTNPVKLNAADQNGFLPGSESRA